MTIVVSDTSPIRALNHLGLLDLLGILFDRVLVPPAVQSELERPKAGFVPIPLRHLSFVEIVAPHNQATVSSFESELELAESEAIALALTCACDAAMLACES